MMDKYAVSIVVLVICLNCQALAMLPHTSPVNMSESTFNADTEGASGVRCTRIGRHCITGVDCVNKQCVCPTGEKGKGEIECIPQENYLCTVTADPHLCSYDNAHADVDLPCRYRLTRFVTDHRSAATPHAYCAVEVYATNELNKGQYYVRSVHISIGITDSGQQVHDQFEVRKFGVSDDDIYKLRANVTTIRTLWGVSLHETIKGVDVFPTFDEDNNFAILSVPQCGTRIKYRAYDRDVHRQRLLPGISIMAPPDLKFVDGYGHYPHSLCGTNNDTSSLYTDRAEQLGLDNIHLAVIYDILKESAPQHSNPKKEECEEAMDLFKDSDDPASDINFCGPILEKPKARKCLDENNQAPIDVFNACLKYRKTGKKKPCQVLEEAAALCGPKSEIPEVVCS